MFGYDPEAIYQDADIEMLELRDAANEQAAFCKAGDHTPHREDGRGVIYCLHCMADIV
jgi:hypothetical protein